MTQNTYCIHGKVRQRDKGTHYECLYYPHPVFEPLQIFTKSNLEHRVVIASLSSPINMKN
jgi:hypothetical protein